jgi:hypothetical protein
MIRRLLRRLAVLGLIASALMAIFFVAKVRERNIYVHDLIRSSLSDVDRYDPSVAAVALSRAIYQRTNRTTAPDDLDWFSRWESTSLFNVTSGTSLRYGVYGIEGHSALGPCGSMSRALLNALWALDIPARKLQLLDNEDGLGGGHTLVEFYDRGEWRVISPSDSAFVWRDDDGDIASAEQIRNDPTLYASVHRWKADFPYRFDNYQNIRWEKLPGAAQKVIRAVIGPERFADATTPRLYDLPRTLFLIVSLALFVFFLVMILFTRPRTPADQI